MWSICRRTIRPPRRLELGLFPVPHPLGHVRPRGASYRATSASNRPGIQSLRETMFLLERIELGKRLFYDPILSIDSTISCGSCHKQEFAFADNLDISPGVDNRFGFRNSMSLTNLAYHKREISVFGGNQLRPNVHIKDMVNAYEAIIEAPESKIKGEIFNVGYENKSVLELANIVKKIVGSDVVLKTTQSNDNRSYHISSNKIKKVYHVKLM